MVNRGKRGLTGKMVNGGKRRLTVKISDMD